MTRVRLAVEDDVAELVRLRALLFETLDGDFFNPPSGDGGWRDACAATFREQLGREQLGADTMRVLVVDGDDGLAACGIGTVQTRLPAPHLVNGRGGQVLGVITDPAYRRRGYSRAIMRGLLDWFRERDVSRVDLHASRESEPLYRELGFVPRPDPALSWRP